ncbi:Cobyrinic acid ac-diamide synthase [Sulfobacillus acidophilus TPY]|uniref:Cobyrinic acid ac-diamide synthase n=1 Tax=Sulfobacillus acidophilus (strain ATCC 700253 / DSM 10332 / NAL) TaxID=679936 RepID=G8U1H4_SULAD|nr:Cobyrinic acid ac-diamide synthase [Sulfobacillus acidophilus TPY]AEW06579.1 Cobyrinic acid ac-diamide synthase [Sulfobacillus acidophilus DSM 10332]
MANQGDQLRQWVRSRVEETTREVLQERIEGARVLAVASGKGGVGKTSLTLNLSLALADRGQRVVVLDADLGLANINILLGYEPVYTLWDVVERHIPLRDTVQPGPKGIRIIPGGSGIAELARLDTVEISHIIEGFHELEGECDWLMIDTGAGLSEGVLAFVLAADETLVVTNPEPTALADAYGLIKAVWEQEGRVALKLVMNRVKSLDQGAKLGQRLTDLAQKALGQSVEFLGSIADDANVARAVMRQEPFYLAYPKSEATMAVGDIADRLLHRVPPPRRGGWGAFMKRLMDNWTIPGAINHQG